MLLSTLISLRQYTLAKKEEGDGGGVENASQGPSWGSPTGRKNPTPYVLSYTHIKKTKKKRMTKGLVCEVKSGVRTVKVGKEEKRHK